MKTTYITLLLLLSCFVASAQLSNKHYLPPVFIPSSADATGPWVITLTTFETSPFEVKIYRYSDSGKEEFKTITISSTSPGFIDSDGTMASMISGSMSDLTLITPNNLRGNKAFNGLYLEAPKSFLVQFQAYTSAQAASLTSKGITAAGTEFYAGHTNTALVDYSTKDQLSNFISIMSTEDNNTVTITNADTDWMVNSYSHDFTAVSGVANSYQITLKEGECVSVAVYPEDLHQSNGTKYRYKTFLDGIHGTHIVSDKDVVVNCGSYCATAITTATSAARDAGFDQIVPADMVGNNYILTKGNGMLSNTTQYNEVVIIVATEDNTTIDVEDDSYTTPITLAKAGDIYKLEASIFYNGSTNKKNAMFSSDKPIYVYQTINGSETGNQTLGFNFVPPLDCATDYQVNLGGLMAGASNTVAHGYTLKNSTVRVNGVANVDSDILVDGIALPSYAYSTVRGSSQYKTFEYDIPMVSENKQQLFVKSSDEQPIFLSLVLLSGSIGSGAYFSGFSFMPIVSSEAVALSTDQLNIYTLEVINHKEGYEYTWFKNDTIVAGETGPTLEGAIGGEKYNVIAIVCDGTRSSDLSIDIYPPLHFVVEELSVESEAYLDTLHFPGFEAPSFSIKDSPQFGTVTIEPDGAFAYLPAEQFFCFDSISSDLFTYKVLDLDGSEVIDTVRVTVEYSNQYNPILHSDTISISNIVEADGNLKDIFKDLFQDVCDYDDTLCYTAFGVGLVDTASLECSTIFTHDPLFSTDRLQVNSAGELTYSPVASDFGDQPLKIEYSVYDKLIERLDGQTPETFIYDGNEIVTGQLKSETVTSIITLLDIKILSEDSVYLCSGDSVHIDYEVYGNFGSFTLEVVDEELGLNIPIAALDDNTITISDSVLDLGITKFKVYVTDSMGTISTSEVITVNKFETIYPHIALLDSICDDRSMCMRIGIENYDPDVEYVWYMDGVIIDGEAGQVIQNIAGGHEYYVEQTTCGGNRVVRSNGIFPEMYIAKERSIDPDGITERLSYLGVTDGIFSLVELPKYGEVTLQDDGYFTYLPDEQYFSSNDSSYLVIFDSFTYGIGEKEVAAAIRVDYSNDFDPVVPDSIISISNLTNFGEDTITVDLLSSSYDLDMIYTESIQPLSILDYSSLNFSPSIATDRLIAKDGNAVYKTELEDFVDGEVVIDYSVKDIGIMHNLSDYVEPIRTGNGTLTIKILDITIDLDSVNVCADEVVEIAYEVTGNIGDVELKMINIKDGSEVGFALFNSGVCTVDLYDIAQGLYNFKITLTDQYGTYSESENIRIYISDHIQLTPLTLSVDI